MASDSKEQKKKLIHGTEDTPNHVKKFQYLKFREA